MKTAFHSFATQHSQVKLNFWLTSREAPGFLYPNVVSRVALSETNERARKADISASCSSYGYFTRPTSEVENSNIILLLPCQLPRNHIEHNADHGLLAFLQLFVYSFLYALLGLCILILMTAMKVGPDCLLKVTSVLIAFFQCTTFGSLYTSQNKDMASKHGNYHQNSL